VSRNELMKSIAFASGHGSRDGRVDGAGVFPGFFWMASALVISLF
jgi:hypothetical protein